MTPLAATRAKPVYGQRCNGCGRCCIAEQCPLSMIVFGRRDRCPALVAGDDGALGCDMAARPEAHIAVRLTLQRPLVEACRIAIGAGRGCDAVFDTADRIVAAAGARRRLIGQQRQASKQASPAARMILTAFRLHRLGDLA